MPEEPLRRPGKHTPPYRSAITRWIPAFATLLSSSLGNAITVIGTALLVRLLGGESFGKAALMTSAAITMGTVTSSGVCLYILRATARGDDPAKMRRNLWAGTLVGQGTSGLITAGLAVLAVLQNERPAIEFLLTGITLHLTTSDALSKNRLIGAQRLVPLALATVSGTAASIGLQLTGAFFGGASGYMLGFALGTGVQAATSWFACHRSLPTMGRPSRNVLTLMCGREFFEFVGIGTLSACVVPLTNWISTLIAAQKTASYGDVATLTVAMQFFNMVIFVPTVMNKLTLPKTIKADAERPMADSTRSARRQSSMMILYTAPLLLVIWLLQRPILEIYRFHSTTDLTVILCFVGASVLACAAIPLSNYFVSHSKMKHGLLGNVAWAIVYLTLAVAFPGGAIAIAGGLLCAYALNLLIALFLIRSSQHAQ